MSNLFDEPEWQEVPQARFLSWSAAEQAAYCEARDYASAAEAETQFESDFHLRRAKMYEEMKHGL